MSACPLVSKHQRTCPSVLGLYRETQTDIRTFFKGQNTPTACRRLSPQLEHLETSAMKTTRNRVDAALTPCTILNRQGSPCGKPGHPLLLSGVCPEHGIEIYRAMAKLVVQPTRRAS